VEQGVAAKPPARLEAIDQFRGLAILGMVLVNYLAGVRIVPAWLKHAPDIGLTVADLVAPFFILAIGLTYGLSARRRLARDGWGRTAVHFFTRWMAIAGIGFFIGAGEIIFGVQQTGINWGVLQAIAVAGLVTLPLLFLPAAARWAAGLLLLAGYQVLLDHRWLDAVRGAPHGGLYGALSWTAMLILATALADLYHDAPRVQRAFSWAGAALLAAGLALSFLTPISKNRVSAPYVLVSLGLGALVFWGFHLLDGRLHVRVPLLSAWGRNPLVLYMLHNLLLGFVYLPDIPAWYTLAPVWLVILQVVGMLGLLSLAGWFMERRGWILSL
jgi:predicted acyltransferase